MFRWFRRWIFRKSKKEYDKWFVWIWQINCLKPKIDRNIHLLDILAFLMLTTWKMRWNLIQNRPKFGFLYQCPWNMAYFVLNLLRNLSRCRFGFTWYHLRKNKPKLPKNRSNLRWSRSEMQSFLISECFDQFLVLNYLFVIFKRIICHIIFSIFEKFTSEITCTLVYEFKKVDFMDFDWSKTIFFR